MRSGERMELSRRRPGAGDRDPHGHAAAVVRVPPDPAILVPADVGDAGDNADGLEECLDQVVGALASEAMACTREIGQVEESAVFEQARGGVALAAEALHTDQSIGAVGGAGPP